MNDRNMVEVHGELIVVNHAALPWSPERTFTVTASEANQVRGNHRTDCNELVILVSGAALFQLIPQNSDEETAALTSPGDRLLIPPNTFVKYTLENVGDTILVICDQIYRQQSERP